MSEIIETKISNFFIILVKKYQEILYKINIPLIIIIEDCNKIDSVNRN
jgi:hypothetical protein